ncbi:hypothetical protein VTK26DRAFT_4980 [Humicola hyalothermophila]
MSAKRRAIETDIPSNANTSVSPDQPNASGTGTQLAPVKRQRVSRACDQCRAAREKCDGVQPECFPCVSQNRSCTYDVSPRKRGVQTGYIRTLELALGWVFERVPGSEESLSRLLAHEGGHGRSVFAGKDPSNADRLHKRWRESRVHRSIDHILSGGSLSSPGHDGRTSLPDASDADGDVARRRSRSRSPGHVHVHGTPDSQRPSVDHRSPTPRVSVIERQREPTETLMFQPGPPPSSRLRLPPNHWRLLDIYFSYTHSWLPILEKQNMFQASYLYPEEGLAVDPREASSAVHAELWAALALASLQDANSRTSTSDSSVGLPTVEIYKVARGLLPSEDGAFQIHHARAFLLLGLVKLGQDKLMGAWLLIGSATRILLGPDKPTPCGPDRKASLTLMACFMMDTILSVRCNMPPTVRSEDLVDLPPIPEDGLDQWEPWAPCDGFGVCCPGSRSSRNPAFCLSTFNQLYAIIKAVSIEVSMKRRGLSPGTRPDLMARLQDAVHRGSPLSSFIMSPSCGTASTPTFYLARATYLWANSIANPHSEGLLYQLSETLEQYQRLFGKCGMAPFIPACLASLAKQQNLLGCSNRQKERVKFLVSAYTPNLPEGSKPSPNSSHTHLVPQPPQQKYPNPNISPLYNSPAATHDFQTHPSNRDYGSFSAPAIPAPYQRLLTNAATTLPEAGNHSTMHMAQVPAISVDSTQQGRSQPTHPPPPPAVPPGPPAGFGPSPDYEALLDDLASIECTDPIDVDPQFMTNLGFAPGCDITEIFTRDFGTA